MTISDSLNKRQDYNLIHLIYFIYIRSTRGTMPWLGRQATVQLLLKGRCDEHQSRFLCQGLQDLHCATKKVYFSLVSTVTFLGVFLYLGLTQNMKYN